MNAATGRWLALLPLLVYAEYLVALARPPLNVEGMLMIVAISLPVVEIVTQRWGVWLYVPGVAVLGALGAGLLRALPSSETALLFLSLLAAAPVWWAAVSRRVCTSLAGSVLAIIATVELSLVAAFTAKGIEATTTGGTPSAWMSQFTSMFASQVESISAFARGSSIPPAPLGGVPDATFAVLAVLPLVVLVASWLAPAWRSRISAGQPGPRPAHLGSLAVAVGAVLAFEGASLVAPPEVTLLGTCTAVAEILVALTILGRTRVEHPGAAPVPTTRPGSAPTGR
ncbi:MAG TPA: hypothetical protein VEY07_01020 [Thermoplasmata archaeon]|nr:hypothetical protein [Thermoplasmata archaeon]